MRPLTEEETKKVFTKLASYTGESLKNLIAPLDDGDRYCLRMIGVRVFYVKLSMANLATSIARDNLLSLGTLLGTADHTRGLSTASPCFANLDQPL